MPVPISVCQFHLPLSHNYPRPHILLGRCEGLPQALIGLAQQVRHLLLSQISLPLHIELLEQASSHCQSFLHDRGVDDQFFIEAQIPSGRSHNVLLGDPAIFIFVHHMKQPLDGLLRLLEVGACLRVRHLLDVFYPVLSQLSIRSVQPEEVFADLPQSLLRKPVNASVDGSHVAHCTFLHRVD